MSDNFDNNNFDNNSDDNNSDNNNSDNNTIITTETKIGNITYVVKSRSSENAIQTLDELINSLIAIELSKS